MSLLGELGLYRSLSNLPLGSSLPMEFYYWVRSFQETDVFTRIFTLFVNKNEEKNDYHMRSFSSAIFSLITLPLELRIY